MTNRSGNDENKDAGAAPPPENPNSSGPEAAETPPAKGLDAALADLRKEYGEDVVTLWRASGPRKGHVAEVACVLAEVAGYPRRIMVQAHIGGTYKLFAEVKGKAPDQMMVELTALFDAD